MTIEDLSKIIFCIVGQCVELKNKYTDEKDLIADYVCVFSHSEDEYSELIKIAEQIGKLAIETPTGPVYAFINPPETITGNPKLLKIRKPDITRSQRGDVDFNTDYEMFKNKYLDNKRFTLIQREDFEMIELRDDNFYVLVYFSSIPLSKQLGVR